MKTAIGTSQTSGLSTCCGSSNDKSIVEEENDVTTNPHSAADATLSIAGMTCGSCASKVQSALQKINGVHSARVIFAESIARVRYDAHETDLNEMAAALEAVGYKAQAADNDTIVQGAVQSTGWLKGPVLWGAAAATAVVAFYLGLITLTSDWSNAAYQFSQYGGWVIALAAGLSLQVGLFVRMRNVMAAMQAKGAGKSLAASGSMSGVAMALCCSHYLATILPAIGLPFLSGAVAGLAQYQTIFFIIGVVSNILGLAYMIRMMMKNGMIGFGPAYQ